MASKRALFPGAAKPSVSKKMTLLPLAVVAGFDQVQMPSVVGFAHGVFAVSVMCASECVRVRV